MRKNEWQRRFGAKRRAIDKRLLQECERSLSSPALEEEVRIDAAERERIARMFGRPVR